MQRFVKNSGLGGPEWQVICFRLLNTDLDGRRFLRIKKMYKSKIPRQYDFLMNLFFQVIYRRKRGWHETAKMIIEIARWAAGIKKKLRESLDSFKQ